jgi:hypothetical protein
MKKALITEVRFNVEQVANGQVTGHFVILCKNGKVMRTARSTLLQGDTAALKLDGTVFEVEPKKPTQQIFNSAGNQSKENIANQSKINQSLSP